MRLIASVSVLVLCMTLLASAAVAGTSADPDLDDPCGEGHIVTEPTTGTPVSQVIPQADIQAAWIEQTPDALLLTLQTCGAPVDATTNQNLAETYHRLRWDVGGCTQSAQYWDHTADGLRVNGLAPTIRGQFELFCDGETTRVETESVVRVGDRVVWTLPLDGMVAPLSDLLIPTEDEPVTLTGLRALTQYHLGLQGYMEGDSASGGRDVVLTVDG